MSSTSSKKVTASEVIANLPSTYKRAKDSGDLFFFPSTVETHVDPSGLEFQLRLCPALQHKPKLPTPHFDPDHDATAVEIAGKHDPFLPPYVPALFVGELASPPSDDDDDDEEYVILLNKYSLVPEHILLVTKAHQSQQSPLYPPDLLAAYDLLFAAQRAGRPFFAFYNCGDRSGASQHHKHMQLMPCEQGDPPIEKLARAAKLETTDRPFTLSSLPYASHSFRLPSSLSSQLFQSSNPSQSSSPSAKSARSQASHTLTQAFLSILDLAIATIRHDDSYPQGPPSYNVILTTEHMHVVPRKEENARLGDTGDVLSVNSVGFAGYLLVKSEEELEAAKKQGLANILKSVALESVHDLQVAGITNEAPDILA